LVKSLAMLYRQCESWNDFCALSMCAIKDLPPPAVRARARAFQQTPEKQHRHASSAGTQRLPQGRHQAAAHAENTCAAVLDTKYGQAVLRETDRSSRQRGDAIARSPCTGDGMRQAA